MATFLKRAGSPLAPPSKRAEKENVTVASGVQRRSARDRSNQKTPLQRLEEFSSALVAPSRNGHNTDNGKPTVLDSSDNNPMAPESKKKGRGSKKKNLPVLESANLSAQNSFGNNISPITPLSIPTMSMQHFAGIATGSLAAPDGQYMYNLQLPTTSLPESEALLADTIRNGSSAIIQPSRQTPRIWPDACVSGSQVGTVPGASGVVDLNGGFNSENTFQPTQNLIEMSSPYQLSSFTNICQNPGQFPGEKADVGMQSANFYSSGDSSLMAQVVSSGSLAQNFQNPLDTNGVQAQGHFLGSDFENQQVGGLLIGSNASEIFSNNGECGGEGNDDGEDEGLLESNASVASDDDHGVEEYGSTSEEDASIQASANVPAWRVLQRASYNPGGPPGGAVNSANNAKNLSGSDNASGRIYDQRRPVVQASGEEHFVLDAHYKRNRRPKPPSLYKMAFGRPPGSTNAVSGRPPLTTVATDSSLFQRPNTTVRPLVAQPEVPKHRSRRPTVEDYDESQDVPVEPSRSRRATVEDYDESQDVPVEPRRRPRRATVEDYDESQDVPVEPRRRSRRATVEDYDESGDDAASEDDASKKARAPRYSKTPRSEKIVTPDKQEYYPPNWQIVLRMAKLLMRRWIVTQQGFPDKNQLYWKAGEILQTALNNHQMAGGFVEEGFYENHRQDMQKLIWDDISTFRGEIKNLAREFIFNYDFLPENAPNSKAFERQVVANITNLLRGGFFLRHGVDANGRPNNFCHPVLRRLILTALYSNSSKIGSRFREDFAFEVPRQALALAATAIICALEEWQTGKHKNLKFSYDDYREKHARMLGLLAELENDDYQSVKLQAMRQQWAQAGAMQGGPQAANVDMGFAVAL